MNQVVTLSKDILSTTKMEQWMASVKETIARYRRIEQSEDLKEYLALQAIVETEAFQDNKHTLLTRKYRDTEEYQTTHRHARLHRFSFSVLKYRYFHKDSDIAAYMLFAQTDDFAKLSNEEAVKDSAELQLYKKLEKTFKMRQYQSALASEPVKEYLNLQSIILTDEFQQRNMFWSNPNRWYLTDESKQDARYTELKHSDDIQFFFAHDAKLIAEWERYHIEFQDEFSWDKLANSKWEAGFYYANKHLKTNHSYTNELQAYNEGRNVLTTNGNLVIETRKETITASAWHPTKGFIPHHFSYTSDHIQTAKHFHQFIGVFSAKVRFIGGAHGAAYLATDKRLPLLTLAQWDGKNVSLGMRAAGKNGEVAIEQVTVDNIKSGDWMIYSIYVSPKEIIWYVNNKEVLRLDNTLQEKAYYPAITGFIPATSQPSTGKVEVDWVKVYAY